MLPLDAGRYHMIMCSLTMVGKCISLSGHVFGVDQSYQNEATLTEDPQMRRTFLSVSLIKDERLQVPFPPLNKDLPPELDEVMEVSVKMIKGDTPSPLAGEEGKQFPDELEPLGTIPKQRPCGEAVPPDALIVHEFLKVLEEAVMVRLRTAPWLPANEDCASVAGKGPTAAAGVVSGRARVALLFSGGLDSAVMAALVDRQV